MNCKHREIEHLTRLGEKHDIAICRKCEIIFFDGISTPTLTEMWKH